MKMGPLASYTPSYTASPSFLESARSTATDREGRVLHDDAVLIVQDPKTGEATKAIIDCKGYPLTSWSEYRLFMEVLQSLFHPSVVRNIEEIIRNPLPSFMKELHPAPSRIADDTKE